MDRLIGRFDRVLRVVVGVTSARRLNPADRVVDHSLDPDERRRSVGLMRVNHVGEVCAQALYEAQGRHTRNAALRRQFEQAACEEEDHLAWTAERLRELGARPSLFNPLWYAGAYALGAAVAKFGDKPSLGFVVETERQVESHLASHLESLPLEDKKSRAIVAQMKADEVAHGAAAQAMGASELPVLAREAMRAMAKVMTTTAYYI